jgi:hypothetical protein
MLFNRRKQTVEKLRASHHRTPLSEFGSCFNRVRRLRILSPSVPNPLLFDTVRRVNKIFFEITSRQGKVAYIPWSQLLRIEAIPGGGIFLSFSENFQVNIQIANGEEAAVAKRLYNDLASPLAEVIILNPETQSVTDIHF